MKIFTYIKNDSNRINKKNFQLIGNLELWKHLIYELNKLGSKIYIDTDASDVIRDCSVDPKLSNVIAYPRKNEYIKIENDPNNNLSPANLMLENFLDTYVTDEDEMIILTHVTSPFLKKETIVDVIQRTQDLKPIYFSNGAFFVMTKRIFKKNKNRWGSSVYFYPLNAIEGVEIDYPEDLKLAKIIYGGIK